MKHCCTDKKLKSKSNKTLKTILEDENCRVPGTKKQNRFEVLSNLGTKELFLKFVLILYSSRQTAPSTNTFLLFSFTFTERFLSLSFDTLNSLVL